MSMNYSSGSSDQEDYSNNSTGGGFHDINITPFVDVVLVLLVIFMVTAPIMVKESLMVELPQSGSSDESMQAATKNISITSAGAFLFDGKNVSDQELQKILDDFAQTKTKVEFLIAADKDSKYSELIKVIDYLKKRNLDQFALQVEKTN